MRGLQTEITYKGNTVYIQTQDKGSKAQYVESLVYVSGKVLVSRKTSYTTFINTSNLRAKIKDIISSQHKKILEELSNGQLDHLLIYEEKSDAPQKKDKAK